jgi:hypothetical protein
MTEARAVVFMQAMSTPAGEADMSFVALWFRFSWQKWGTRLELQETRTQSRMAFEEQ